MRLAFLLPLFFASGVAALIYEVLWLKELGRLFGVTAHAAATTLAVFFLGLSAGGWVWGRKVAQLKRPLRVYSYLELGIAVTALLYFLILDLYHWINTPLFSSIGYHPALALAIKFVLAGGILFLPAFFMGGTLPVMAQYLVKNPAQLGRRASLLYAINTLGATVGALVAGFWLPRHLGFRNSYFVAIAINLFVFALTFAFSRRRAEDSETPEAHPRTVVDTQPRSVMETGPQAPSVAPRIAWTAAFVSGFVTLGMEVLWTRMFAQVLQNSVYTFSIILTVFLAALALGSVAANGLCRVGWPPRFVLFALLSASGFLVGLTPLSFNGMTAGLQVVAADRGWTAYVMSVGTHVAAVIFLPTVVMGTVFPYLMKLSEPWMRSAGRTIGQLAAVNTVAAILGSLAAGFLLLETLGLWESIRLLAVGYLVLAIFTLPGTFTLRWVWRSVPVLGIVVFALGLTYGDMARMRLDTGSEEQLVELWEGSHGTVAVVRRGDDLRLKINSSYNLGASSTSPNFRLQSQIPLSLHPDPKRVFYLGMGTGITAGGALDFPVERVVVCELNRDVVEASRKHFGPWINRLYDDPRVTVLAEDGRTYLSITRELFDAIIGDIFLTYKAGVGSLYTLEHFKTVRSRLAPGGIFVQWLPMFDLSEPEFGIIARTMLEVFPQVTLWRRGFSPTFPVFALMGHVEPARLDEAVLENHLTRLVEKGAIGERVWFVNIPLAAYAGDLSQMTSMFGGYAISTDDRTPLEYMAPITDRESRGAGRRKVLAWLPLADFCTGILEAVPPESDPYLTGSDSRRVREVPAGLAFYRSEVHRRLGNADESRAWRRVYEELVTEAEDVGGR